MKVVIPSRGDTLDSLMDDRFGRAAYFIIYDTDTNEFEAIKNPYSDKRGGVGISVAKLCVEKGVNAAAAEHFGPNTLEILKPANVELFQASRGTVKDVIDKLKEGSLKEL